MAQSSSKSKWVSLFMLLCARLATAIVIEDDWKHACLRSQEGVESPQRPTRYSKATSRHPA